MYLVKYILAFLISNLSELSTKLISLEESNSQFLNSLNIFSEILIQKNYIFCKYYISVCNIIK
jgi:polyphosphate kinase 2 (PPK2 family)